MTKAWRKWTRICMNEHFREIANCFFLSIKSISGGYNEWPSQNHYHHTLRIILVNRFNFVARILCIYHQSIWSLYWNIDTNRYNDIFVQVRLSKMQEHIEKI